jgi:hypothetical protein
MTADMLEDTDPDREIESWLVKMGTMMHEY